MTFVCRQLDKKQHLEDESGGLVSLEEEMINNMLKTNDAAF